MSVVIGFDVNRKKSNLKENEIFIPIPAIIAIANIKIDEANIFLAQETKQDKYPPN